MLFPCGYRRGILLCGFYAALEMAATRRCPVVPARRRSGGSVTARRGQVRWLDVTARAGQQDCPGDRRCVLSSVSSSVMRKVSQTGLTDGGPQVITC